jgi:hypothetical protein
VLLEQPTLIGLDELTVAIHASGRIVMINVLLKRIYCIEPIVGVRWCVFKGVFYFGDTFIPKREKRKKGDRFIFLAFSGNA